METLTPNQIEHVDGLISILMKSKFYLDCSRTGLGKTRCACAVAKDCGLNLVVIAPNDKITQKWFEEAALMGVNIVCSTTYGMLISKKKSLFTTQHEEENENNKTKTVFEPSEYLKNILLSGNVLLVVDEVHNFKNDSQRNRAICAINRFILKRCSNSRIALLSATPYDKVEHIINLYRVMGIITKDKLAEFFVSTGLYSLVGYEELLRYSNHVNKAKTQEVLGNEPNWKGKQGKLISHQIFIRIIKAMSVRSMVPISMNVEFDAKNGIYLFANEEHEKELIKAVNLLSRATRYNDKTNDVNIDNNSFGLITNALKSIETAKIPLLERKAYEILNDNPKNKVIIYCSYNDTIHELMSMLSEFNPVMLNGEVRPELRNKIIDKFNEPSTESRLIIGNIRVGKEGIDLHDRHGGFERTMLIVPNYSIQDLHQAAGRIYRMGTKSSAHVRFVYGKTMESNIREDSILDALARKKDIMKDVVLSDDNRGEKILFPGEYEPEEEGIEE